jgi:7,8-dihydropterin-6-yl-methyl-4-(beta-D-ribofuranosyl)aminobenzene 5'-phosphate synthase
MAVKKATITILMDNTAAVPSLTAEHGLSMWIEIGNRRILWDAGQSDAVFENARRLGIDLSKADTVALSHGHYDHTGGLAKALTLMPTATLYLHARAMDAKYSLKNGQSRPVGMSHQSQWAVLEKDIAGSVVFVTPKTELADGLTLTGPVPRRTPYEDTGGLFYKDPEGTVADDLPDDQSLFFECSKGIVVVLGCAHSGVVNILNAVADWTGSPSIYAVLGGMHLIRADSKRIEETLNAFKRFDVQKIAPLHCTGTEAMRQLKEVFGDRCLLLGAGSSLCF